MKKSFLHSLAAAFLLLGLAGPVAADVLTFQQGVSGYTGLRFTTLVQTAATSTNGGLGAGVWTVDGGSGAFNDGQFRQGLIRFDNIFGAGVGQIPLGSTISAATITANYNDNSSTAFAVYRILVPWETTNATWNFFTAGLTNDGVEAASSPTVTFSNPNANAMGTYNAYGTALTNELAAWSAGTPNYGWVVLPTSGNQGWGWTAAGGSPVLSVTFTPPPSGVPSVTLTAPANGASASAPATINLTASANGGLGTVSSVAYYYTNSGGVTFVGFSAVGTTYPVSTASLPAGSYGFYAVVTNSLAEITNSVTNVVTLTNIPLSVVLTSPANGASFASLDAITIAAAGGGPAPENMKFYIDGGLSNTVAAPGPYSYTQPPASLAAGTHTIYAEFTDSTAGTTNSVTNTFTVVGPIEVTVAGVTNSLGVLPKRSQFATIFVAGAASDVFTDAVQNLLNAATITNAIISEAQNTTANQTPWKWEPTFQYVYNGGAGGQSYNLVMATIKNVTGSTVNSLQIAYDYVILRAGAGEEVPGLRVYYSLTGAPGSWANLPAISPSVSNAPIANLSTNLTLTWPANALLYVMWTDDNGLATSGVNEGMYAIDNVAFVPSPAAPAVSLTNPANGASAEAPAIINLTATASGGSGATVSSVAYFYTNNGVETFVGSSAAGATYLVSTASLPVGQYGFYAIMTNSLGAVASSVTNLVTVTSTVPAIVLTAPTNGAAAAAPAIINLTATASGGGGATVSSVAYFYTNSGVETFVGSSAAGAAYPVSTASLPVGSYGFYAIMTNSLGATASSLTNVVTLTNLPLTVELTSPTNAASFTSLDAITITATAAGSAPVNMKFYLDGGLSNTVAAPGPYSYTPPAGSLTSGSHTIFAQFTDNIGGTTNSATNTFTVVGPIAVTAAGVTNTFSSQPPPRSQWVSIDIPGATTENPTPAAMDISQNLLNAATITNGIISEAQNTGGNQHPWKWEPTVQYLYQGAAAGNAYNFAMATLKNVTGSTVFSLRIAYDYTIIRDGAGEEIPGLRVYYSLTGLPGSWANLPAISPSVSNAPVTFLSTNLSLTWPANALLYVMWTDDNASAVSGVNEGMYAIDNVSFTPIVTVVDSLTFQQQPAAALANAVITPEVQVLAKNSNNIPVGGAPVTLTLSSGTGILSGILTTNTDANGVAHFSNLSIDTTGAGKILSATNAATLVGTNSTAFSVVADLPPAVSLTSPASGVAACSVTNVTIAAAATDNSAVTNVDFQVNGVRVGGTNLAPYSIVFSMSPGNYSITAVATDEAGLSSTSAPVLITAPNCPPSVPVLVAPAHGATGVSIPPSLQVAVADPEAQSLTVTYYGRVFDAAPAPGPDFTIVAIPDTQYYVAAINGGTPPMMFAQTDWIATNRAASNIVFVAGLGDCVESGDANPFAVAAPWNTAREWDWVTNGMYRLENPLTTGLPDGTPYQLSVGNHDQGPVASGPAGTTTNYNLHFGTNHFAGKSYYGGHYGTNNNNHYVLFSASGLDFIAISLEYNNSNASGGTANSQELTNVLAWADALLKTHRHRRAILISHAMINVNTYVGGATANAPFSYAQGQAIYDALNDNTNLFLMLAGHQPSAPFAGRRYDTTNGRTLVTLMSDYQVDTNGGSGFLRLYTFSPARNEIQAQTYSPYFGGSKTDTNHQFTVPYDMTVSAPFLAIGTNTGVASGSTSARIWAGLADGTTYEWYAVVSDGTNTVRGTTNTFTTSLITRQPANVTNNVGGNATFNVTAGVAPVQYQWYFGVTPVANATNASLTLTNVQTGDAGGYQVAVTNSHGHQLSSVATLTVNQPPVAGADTLVTTVNTARPVTEATLLANDSDPDGGTLSVTGVGQSTNGAVVTRSAGVVTYTPVPGFTGVDQFTYNLSDGQGGSVTGVVNVTVAGPPAIVRITLPAPNGPVTLVFIGLPGQAYQIQATTNIAPVSAVNWITLGTTNAGTNGLFQYLDLFSPPPPSRFYRIFMP